MKNALRAIGTILIIIGIIGTIGTFYFHLGLGNTNGILIDQWEYMTNWRRTIEIYNFLTPIAFIITGIILTYIGGPLGEIEHYIKTTNPKPKQKPNRTKKPQTRTQTKYCSNCGNKIKKETKYCPNCGTKT